MKIATFMMPLHPPGKNYVQSLREDREAIILADELGYEEAYVGEHITDAAETVTHCMTFLASLIPVTKRIKLGAGTINIPNSHPAAIAAQVAMMDHLCEGRFIMGISPGGLASDAEVFGNWGNDRTAMFIEGINMVLKIWESEPPYNLEGKFWKITTEKTMIPEIGQGIILKPFQKPHPPIVGTVVAQISTGGRGGIGRLIIEYARETTAQPAKVYIAVIGAILVGLIAAGLVALLDLYLTRNLPKEKLT